jgi:hypothetical protein
MAVKNASASPAVQQLIAWYEQKIAIADRDPVSEWPWAFGRFSDGTPIAAGHRWFYRENRDLQRAFPDPYDARADRRTFLGWCKSEGRLRYPECFTADGGCTMPTPSAARSRVSFAATLRLLALLLSPKNGKAMRSKALGVLRAEGLRGFTRRLPGPRG